MYHTPEPQPGVIMVEGSPEMVECACGCGTLITRKGKNGKPRKYLRGHQTRGRKKVDRSSEAYWENRVRRMNTSAPLCRCGCGDPVAVTVSWLRQASENGTRPVWRPKYVEGHMPQVPCGCGCGTLVDILDVRGQPRSCVPSHAGRLSTPPEKVDWESRTSEWTPQTALAGVKNLWFVLWAKCEHTFLTLAICRGITRGKRASST